LVELALLQVRCVLIIYAKDKPAFCLYGGHSFNSGIF
jgi:hypothetical protein